ncbi:MAG: glycosyltransferase, partial [Bacteroidota bacterium]
MSKKNYISLIIPVYNCEKFLPALFSSIDNQSVKPGEVIIIDDNSVDNSAKLIKEYAKHNNNIKTVFLRKNKGVSYARNKGFELAKGDYLWFIDGDDQLNDNALKGIYSEIQKNNSIEAFVSGYNNLDGQGNFLSERKFLQFDIKKSYPGSEIFKQFNPAPWNKIFKTSFWKKHNFTFPLNISISQDLSIIYYAIFKASKVKILPNCLYNYCYNESSTVNSFNTKKIKDIFAGNQQLFNNFFTEKKALSEAIKLEVSEISIHSIDYFYCRFQSSFSKKDHLLFLDLFNNFLGTNNIDIHSLLSWEIGSKTLIEVDKGIVSNRIKGFINVPFRSDKLLTQIQKIKKLELSNAQTIQDLQQEITNQKYLLSHEKENYELQRNGLNEKIHELEKNIHEHIAFGSKKDEQVNSLSVEKQQLLETAKMLETSYIQKQNSLNNSIEQLNHQLQTKEQEVKSLQKKLTSSEDQNKEYKLRLDKIRLQNEKLEQNIGNIQNSLISSEEQNTNHKLNIDNLYSENKLLIEQIQSKKNEISHLQNKLISSESLNNTYKNQSFKLELEISKLSEAINWYKRTYQDRKLPGIIKDRIIKTIPLFRSENYISQWKNLTRIFRRKNKLKKATVKSTVSK